MHSIPDDTYLILSERREAQFREKGSRFIARAIPVTSVDEATSEIALLKRKEYDATHHCTAYRIGANIEHVRSNDDGEPSGTAGAPILRQLESAGLTNTLIVVTRYYGGTKLGTGGLIRAYSAAAETALRGAVIETVIRRIGFRLEFAYQDTSPAMHTIQRFDATISSTDYGDNTSMGVRVKKSDADAFEKAFVDALSGKGCISRGD